MILKYRDKEYPVSDELEVTIRQLEDEGNCCSCILSNIIRNRIDPTFEQLMCGNEIEVIGLQRKYQ